MIGYRFGSGKMSYWAATYANGRPTGKIYLSFDPEPFTHDFWLLDGKFGWEEAEEALGSCTKIDEDGFLQLSYYPNKHYMLDEDDEDEDDVFE